MRSKISFLSPKQDLLHLHPAHPIVSEITRAQTATLFHTEP